jgi:hypothetical protein
MGLSRQLVIFGIVIGGYQLIQSRSRGKDLEEYYNLKYGAESAGERVRNRLQGADVGPQDEMLDNPSIYRDWAMVQKGYQSLRMMNDNDNFDAESFSSEWHYFSECETKGCDGSIEYRDVYACPSCGQDDVEILLGDKCPDCSEIAEDVSKYAIFYCSECGEDYTDEYNSEEGFGAETYSGKKLNDKIDAGGLTHIYPGDYNNPKLTYYLQLTDAEFKATYPVLACQYCGRDTKMVKVSPDGYEITYKCDPVCMPVFKSAESFSAHVYRGKPMSELGYAGRAMATQKMIKAADIEQSILQLEAAIKVGLISEDEIMDQLRKKFSE